jgi:hypothetical protein
VKVCDAETQLGVDCKAAIGCEHADAGGLEGVVGREHQLAMVQPALKVSALGTLQHKVPFQQIVWQWVGLDVWHRLLQRWHSRAG